MDTKFCEICDESYDEAAPECPGCVRRRYDEAQAAAFAALRAERDAALAEIAQLRKRLADAEKARDRAQDMQRLAEAFHDVAVKERDLARLQLQRVLP